MPAATQSEKPEKLVAKDGPNRGAVFFSNQKYMADSHNRLWPRKKSQIEDKKYLEMRPYDPFVQGVPGFSLDNPLSSMSREELIHYAAKKHPKTVKIDDGMTLKDIMAAIRLREQKLVDLGHDPELELRFKDLEDDDKD